MVPFVNMQACPFCAMPAEVELGRGGGDTYDCLRCGKYKLTSDAERFLGGRPLSERQIANIAGYIREYNGLTIYNRDLDRLESLQTPGVGERANRALIEISRIWPDPGQEFFLEPDLSVLFQLKAMLADNNCTLERCDEDAIKMLRVMGASGAARPSELHYLIYAVLKEGGYLSGEGQTLTVSPSGWAFVEELRSGRIESTEGFVAMRFTEEFLPVYNEGLSPGIRDAGYKPIRVDRIEHNGKIDDEIIAAIRRCKFLVADFSVNRGGIYFEAGYAMGLARPVIWTVEEGELDNVHFDNRQYNFIQWSRGRLPELASALQNRIEATIGRGPL